MIKTNFSLRSRIFISMIVLVLLASVLIAGITIYQYSEQAKDYHADRLERKEEQLKRSLWYTLQESPLVQTKPMCRLFLANRYTLFQMFKT